MIEPVGGVFVGRPTAAVRERIWRRAMRSETAEGIVLIYSASSDQGFSFRVAGDPKRAVTDLDGAHFPTMQEGEMPE
jgi:CRISPR-associated protein Cas2